MTFDNSKISYEKILEVFWKNIDPFDSTGQFCDKGEQYTSGIFYSSPMQKKLSEKSYHELENTKRFKGKKIAAFLRPAATFYPAEEYHQDYYKKNPIKYKFYRYQCGRDKRLESIWSN